MLAPSFRLFTLALLIVTAMHLETVSAHFKRLQEAAEQRKVIVAGQDEVMVAELHPFAVALLRQ